MRTSPATLALSAAGIPFVEHSYEHDPASTDFGREASRALGLEPERVFKTLLVDLDGDLVVGIVPVTGRLDTKSLARALGGRRAEMADPRLAEKRTGYVVGGISPIGQKSDHRTALDETAELWDTICVSGGRRGFELELAPRDLVLITDAVVAAIAR